MEITRELAYPILEKVLTFVDFNINIMNHQGVIVASGNEKRLNQIHDGAIKVLKSKQKFVIQEEEYESLNGTKPGVNLPIFFNDEVIGVVGVTGNPSDISKYTKFIQITVEVLIQQLYMNDQIHYQRQVMESWALDLISPEEVNIQKLESIGKHFLQLDYERVSMSVLILQLEDFQKIDKTIKSQADLQNIVREKEKIYQIITLLIPGTVYYAYLNDGLFLIAYPIKDKVLDQPQQLANEIVRYLMSIGYSPYLCIGNDYKGIEGYRRSYFQAKQSLILLEKFRNKRVAHIKDWGMMRLFDSIPSAISEEYYQQYDYNLNQLTSELEETLRVFFSCNLNHKHTSEQLFIHRNTLNYRLDSITGKLNLDPRIFQEAMHLQMLMILKDLKKTD